MVINDSSFTPEDKAHLLLKVMTATEPRRVVESQISTRNYTGVFDILKACFGTPKDICREYFLAVSKKYIGINRRDINQAIDTWEVLRQGLFGSLFESHLDTEMYQKWTDYSSSSKTPPTVSEIMKFLEDKVSTSFPAEPLRKNHSHELSHSKPR